MTGEATGSAQLAQRAEPSYEPPRVFCIYGFNQLRLDFPEVGHHRAEALGPAIKSLFEDFIGQLEATSSGPVTDIIRERELGIHPVDPERPVFYIVNGEATGISLRSPAERLFGSGNPNKPYIIEFTRSQKGAKILHQALRNYAVDIWVKKRENKLSP